MRRRFDGLRDSLSLQADRVRSSWPILRTLITEPGLRSWQGIRFLELGELLARWLRSLIETSPESALAICRQFANVRKNCDAITYDEDGAAQAYVLLHFLDRYHRFQVTFEELARLGIMPSKKRIDVLDIGTGPGPSMFAASDFYRRQRWRLRRAPSNVETGISIDYAERSHGFRNWLHHFTELANYRSPSGVGWAVPYHHGTTYDFDEIEFDRRRAYYDYDDDGELVPNSYVEKSRPDLVVMSNFLTTGEQAAAFTPQIRDCARNLRHGGLLVIVGARRGSAKYEPVYEAIDRAVLDEDYSQAAYCAKCERVALERPVLCYDYQDEWGRQLKRFYAEARRALGEALGAEMPTAVDRDLAKWSDPDYSHAIRWEVTVYRKIAIPRRSRRRKTAQRAPLGVRG